MVSLVGPLATIGYEPRQARKGATVVADSCAGVRLARAAIQFRYCDTNGSRSCTTLTLGVSNIFFNVNGCLNSG